MSDDHEAISKPTGLSHVRLTVTDITRSKAFYTQLFGAGPARDFSDRIDEPGVRQDPSQLFGGCGFALGDQILGLRPAASPNDRFDSTRVGLDHVSILLASVGALRQAATRLDEAGVRHGELIELTDYGLAIVSVQDPDDINVELSAPLQVTHD